ncbi:hypothetical protein BVX94_02875 [bacterium B17]|nr:hypothetical protein BVX94_02875 [bacterium B17]
MMIAESKSCSGCHNRVLIADDEREVCKFIRSCFFRELPDCWVDIAVSGEEVVSAFRETRSNAIVLDIFMPSMNGVEAFHKIMKICEEEGWEIPIFIFHSAFHLPKEIQEYVGKDPGHCCILQKPVDIQVLIEEIKNRLAA